LNPALTLDKNAVLRLPEFRFLLCARLAASLAMSAMVTVIGFQVFELTRDPLSLGWLGLVEAIPALSLALLGGHVADRNDRRKLILIFESIMVICALLLAFIATDAARYGLVAMLAVIFVSGIAGGFSRPAQSAFEAQVIPIEYAATGASWVSSVGLAGSVLGPAIGGLAAAVLGVPNTYLLTAGLLALTAVCIARIAPKPKPIPEEGESIWQSISQGAKYVLKNQYLAGSMALDLFAVLFGGAMAMLPVFASDILKVGPVGLGLLRTAPSVGALLVMLMATRRPPTARAGRNLFLCVAGFGVSMVVFALSQNFVLSLIALFFSGVTDGVSMVIRSVIVRVMSPEHMRGRIASVSWIFIGASNELGAFESGVAARLLGVAPSVFIGGIVTLIVVGVTALLTPKLRMLNLDQHQIEEKAEQVAQMAEEAGEVQPAGVM
jgi:MFS family permease